MTSICGDDLVAARRFTDLCHRHMREIFSGDSLPLADVVARLADIQSHAKLMHARAIYKSAQTVIDDLTKRCSVQACAGSVLVLQRLIRQYETGLNEIMPAAPKVQKPKAAQPSKTIAPVSEKVKQKQAAEILQPLIKFAPESEQAPLVKLMSFAANDKAITAKPHSNKIDILMPGLTNQLLRLARTQGKSVSISYASDESLLGEAILKLLQSQLETIGESLINYCVETPEARQQSGQSQSAHMAVTSRLKNDALEVLISCEGVSGQWEMKEIILPPLSELGVTSRLINKENLTVIEVSDIPLSLQPSDTVKRLEAIR